MFQLNLKISKKLILPMNVRINQLTYSYILTQNTYWWSNSKFWWDSQPFVIPHFNILVFPTRQHEPCRNKDRAANTLLKVHDRWFLSLASKKDEFGWYLAFHVPTMSLMVRKAPTLLNEDISLKPKPPWSFGRHNFDHHN